MKTFNVVIGLLALGTYSARADEDFSRVAVKATRITSSLYMLEGAGANITALIGPNGILLVDDDFYEMAPKLAAKLKELGGGEPRLIINTHFHYDHSGGNRAFSNAIILAAQGVRDRLSSEQVLWQKTHPAVLDGLPNLTFHNRLQLFFNDDAIEVLHLPGGHTDGDTIVIFKNAKVASLGDLYFSGMYPIFHPEHGGSLRQYLKNLEVILARLPDGAVVVAGHGPLSDKRGLAEYTQMIRDGIRSVKTGIRHGLSLEKIIQRGLDPKWESYSHGYRSTAQWITSIYESCSGNKTNN